MNTKSQDVNALRARLANAGGREFWRSLDELADTPEFNELLKREFPRGAAEWRDPVSRRNFLKLMGASLALAGLSGCQFALKQPQEKIVPYVRQPEEIIHGKPLFFATAATFAGFGTGVLVESHEGRPTKIEGNPDHPASLGSTDLITQAMILTMYDPDRSQRRQCRAERRGAFVAAATAAIQAQAAKQDVGLLHRIRCGQVANDHCADAGSADAIPAGEVVSVRTRSVVIMSIAGARVAFGEDVQTIYRLDAAKVIVGFDSDFRAPSPTGVRMARQLADGRRIRKGTKEVNRLYLAESTPSITGLLADHRQPVRSSQIEHLVRALAILVGVPDVAAGAALNEAEKKWVEAVAKDVQAHRGACVVLVGENQPPVVHALGHAINAQLGNVGSTVVYTDPVESDPSGGIAALSALTQEMNAGTVEMLVMLDSNPVYNAPADIPFAEALAKVPLSVHVGLYRDETAQQSTWHINGTHFLEAWGDVRAFDGTVTIVQPLIAPLYNGKSAIETLNVLLGKPQETGYQTLTAYWQTQDSSGNFRVFWNQALHDGIIPGTQAQARQVTLQRGFASAAPSAPAQGLEIIFRPDPSVWDGAFANNAWLQEVPKPYTKLTWDNVALMSVRTADALRLKNGDVVRLTYQGRSVDAPVWVQPGHADDAVTVHLGFGRTAAGRVGNNVGFNAYRLRTSATPWFGVGLEVAKVGENYKLASTQGHFLMEGRKKDLVRYGTLKEYEENEEFLKSEEKEPMSLIGEFEYNGYKWGMSIDLNVCNSCNACVVACQSENNIPVVGKDEVWLGREMHWIRIDQYYVGDEHTPDVYNMVMLCQQCEHAPCEIVCPVAATVHDAEGLNNMVYNRCVGTKYCSNNCPYKVRRFNFLQYQDVPYRSPVDASTENDSIPVLKMMRNPDVTVRARGVMEKCSFCVQRINAARIEARRENRRITDGEVVTACQQVCPTQAIIFGDLNDPQAQVVALKDQPLNYTSLDKLNTKPRVSYLAKIKNLTPDLAEEKTA
jgi:quinol:cytochrome c oxidoreductase iron-sulfur protein precursor